MIIQHLLIKVWLNVIDSYCLYYFIKILSNFPINVRLSGFHW